MKDGYPFRGIWRWLLLPLWMTVAGMLSYLAGCARENSWFMVGAWLVIGGIGGFNSGVALAVGRRPALAAPVAFALGFGGSRVFSAVLSDVFGVSASMDDSLHACALRGVDAVLIVLAHLGYLKLRRLGVKGALAGGAGYLVAIFLPMWVFTWIHGGGVPGLVVPALTDAAFAWGAMAVAARVSERAAPAPTPPAPGET